MCNLKICRICLSTRCKMYEYNRFQLALFYEELLALHVDEKQNLPRYFCYQCAALLDKFRKFKEKCYTAQNKLIELQWKSQITYENIENLRSQTSIKSSLDIMTVSKRVKTYYFNKDTNIETETDSENKLETAIIKKEQDGDNEIFKIEYVNDYTDNLQSDEENYDSDETYGGPKFSSLFVMQNSVEPGNPKETIVDEELKTNYENGNPEETIVDEELQTNHENGDEKETIIGNFDETRTSVLENLQIQSKDVYVKLRRIDLKKKKNKHKKDYLSMKSSKNLSKRNKKVKRGAKKKDVDFEPDNFSIYGLKERNPAFAKKRKRILDPSHWKKSTLTEDEVLIDMKKKAEDPKYLAAKYKCTDCVKWFREEDILKRHRHLRHNEETGAIECRFCHMRFKWDCHLRKHLRSHFTKYECLRCDLICPLETTALLHEDYHNGVIKKCKYCGEEFKHSSTYYTHLRTHRSEYLCTLCGMSFVSPLGLIMHKRVKHVIGQVEKEQPSEEVDTYCKKCKIRFETKKAYEEHIFQSALHTEGVEEDLEQLKNVYDEDEDKPLSKLSQRNVLIRKRKRPLKIKHRKPTTCHQCGKHFNTQNDCMKHHLAEHRGTSFFPPSERHICEICGQSLAPGSVAMHLNTHTREKLHSCETCGRQFSTSVSLKRHQVTHTGEKRFPCPLCEKRFTQSNSMKLHYRTYHLKEPYPKRNRRKKEIQPEPLDVEESNSCDSCRDNGQRRIGYTKSGVEYLTMI